MGPQSDTSSHNTDSELKHGDLWEAFWHAPDSEHALAALVECWLPLVHSVLDRIAIRLPSHVALEDLLQAGVLGLCKAIQRFQPDKGRNFEGFASLRIRGAILDELRSLDHLSRSHRARIKQVEETIITWIHQHGRPPEEHELAATLGISTEALTTTLETAQPWLSLDETLIGADRDGRALQDSIADPNSTTPDQHAQRGDLYVCLRKAFLHLSSREQKILYLYYYEELRLSEIAALYNLSEARICQIHALAVTKLRATFYSMTRDS